MSIDGAVATRTLDQARVAVVHYWLVSEAGGEAVVREILRLFPRADLFTLVHDPAVSGTLAPNQKLTASWLQIIPGARRHYRKLLPLMPMALEALDLDGYDLIISSESGPAKGIVAPLDALHLCYCHSPMRYLWDQAHEYRARSGWLIRMMMTFFGPALRSWDFQTAQRVDVFMANSQHVQKRIARYWRRSSTVLPPPVHTSDLKVASTIGDYYFIAGRHVGYKRIDLAIDMANQTNRRLVIAGEGPDTPILRRRAGSTVEFRGRVSREELADLYAGCRAFLMPGEEDFGITPVEAMAAGRPVIAYARGGALDTVKPGVSGLLHSEQTLGSMIAAIDEFERTAENYQSEQIAVHAQQFSSENFRASFYDFVGREWATFQASGVSASRR